MNKSVDVDYLCMGCMRKIENRKTPCLHCGWSDGENSHAYHHLPVQTILNGKYLIGKVLGEGGFGITYLGWDLNLDMKVAVKEFYPTGFVSRETTVTTTVTPYSGDKLEVYLSGLDKFVGEAKSLAKFYSLPGIVSVKDFFKENGTAYIVMEFVEGITLKQHMMNQGGKLPAEKVFEMVKPLMQSLSLMHEEGIIHRDISPDNIMVTKGGNLKLLDFGAARDISGDGAKSLSVLLKPGYAPEEQYRTRGNQGPWTDIYALCATIYKAITGETPPEAMERMRQDTLLPPAAFGVVMPKGQEASLLKGLSVYSENRYHNMIELHEALWNDKNRSEPIPIHSDIPQAEDSREPHDQDKPEPLTKPIFSSKPESKQEIVEAKPKSELRIVMLLPIVIIIAIIVLVVWLAKVNQNESFDYPGETRPSPTIQASVSPFVNELVKGIPSKMA